MIEKQKKKRKGEKSPKQTKSEMMLRKILGTLVGSNESSITLVLADHGQSKADVFRSIISKDKQYLEQITCHMHRVSEAASRSITGKL